MSLIYKYRVWCNTDQKWEYVWLEETESEPTTCPTNTAHSVDTTKTSIVDKVEKSIVEIKEETISTNGHFAMEDDLFSVAGSVGVQNFDITIPYDITLLRGRWFDAGINKDDKCDLIIAPNTTIGTLSANANSGATVLNVSSTVVQNIDVGYFVTITDGANTDEVGRCISKDEVNNTITIETALTNNFLAATPTYIQMSIKMAQGMNLMGSGTYVSAEGSMKGANIPANTTIRVAYDNKDGVVKNFHLILEYLY